MQSQCLCSCFSCYLESSCSISFCGSPLHLVYISAQIFPQEKGLTECTMENSPILNLNLLVSYHSSLCETVQFILSRFPIYFSHQNVSFIRAEPLFILFMILSSEPRNMLGLIIDAQ